jgi:uncharacterized membrane protein
MRYAEHLIPLVAAAAIPCTVFVWMMTAAALALITNGESPRAVLTMPRTLLRGAAAPNDGDTTN